VLEITGAELELLDEAFHGQVRPQDTLLAGLLDATVREFRHLRIGLQESTPLVATKAVQHLSGLRGGLSRKR